MEMQQGFRVLVCTARGVQAVLVDDIDTCVALPRLTPLEQTASCVLGAFELRGELVPVISLGMLRGEPTPPAAPSDLVLVVSTATFPLGLYSARPVCIQALSRLAIGPRRRELIELRRLRFTVAAIGTYPDAETRLARFERALTRQALRRLEQRARRYGELAAGWRPCAATAASARH